MNSKNRNLLVRIVSAFTLLPLIIWSVVLGGYWVLGVLCVAAAIVAWEYANIVGLKVGAWAAALAAGALPALAVLGGERYGRYSYWLIGGVFFGAWVFYLLRGPLKEAPTRAAHLLTAVLYGGLGMAALGAVRLRPDGLSWVICAMIISWANDTMAYFAGRFLGRHKLYPEVSPNKTWEGFAGGFVGAVLGLFIYRGLFNPDLTPFDCVVLGIAGSIMGPAGDLCASLIKRAYGVKDSGKIIPGHGGLLDRIDALIFNGPVVFVYVQLFH